MNGKVRSLRLKQELWDKIEKCAAMCDKSVNSFCAEMLSTVCDSFLATEKGNIINDKETDK